jgi:hypothetical protein
MWKAVPIVVAAGVIAWQVLVTRRRRRALQLEVERLAKEAFAGSLPPPAVEIGSSYGFSSFQVTFPSNDALARARHAGLTGRFLDGIQNLCKDEGSKENPFNASAAIWFTSREELARIATTYGNQRR